MTITVQSGRVVRRARAQSKNLHHNTLTSDRIDLLNALQLKGLDTSFGSHSFTRWGIAKLQRLLLLFDMRKSRRVNASELELCEHLLLAKPQPCSDAELAAINVIYHGGGLDDARQVLRTGQPTHQTGNSSVSQNQPTPTLLRLCQACYDQLPHEDFPSITSDAECKHQNSNICAACMSDYIESQAVVSSLDGIRRPEEGCGAILSFYQMVRNAPKPTFERYDSYLVEKGCHLLTCSNPECHVRGLVDPAVDSWVTCNDCGTRTCVSCKTAWHTDISCQVNLAFRQSASMHAGEEAATAVYMARETKNCPDCHIPMVKISGCDHCTCTICRYQFCWACLAPWAPISTQGNHRHGPQCPYYRPYNSDRAPGNSGVGSQNDRMPRINERQRRRRAMNWHPHMANYRGRRETVRHNPNLPPAPGARL